MSLSFQTWLRQLFGNPFGKKIPVRRPMAFRRLSLESLEDRIVPSGLVYDFDNTSNGATSLSIASQTWSLTGAFIGQLAASAGIGAPAAGTSTPDSFGYASTPFGTAEGLSDLGGIKAPTGSTFRATGFDVWPSSNEGGQVTGSTGTGSGQNGTDGLQYELVGYLNGIQVVGPVFVNDTLRTPPDADPANQSGFWHNLDLTGTAFDTTDIDQINIVNVAQIGPNIDYFAIDNFGYSNFTSTSPTITASPSSLALGTTNFGTASASQSYLVSGTNLTADIVITPPTGVELSLNNSTWQSSEALTQSGGTVASTTLYARISASASGGSISGNITDASTGATTQNVSITGAVAPVAQVTPTSQTVANNANTSTFVFSSNETGTTYTWTNDNTTIGIGASGSGSAIASFTATNTGTTPVTATFMVTPTANSVAGSAVPFTLTVNPTPIAMVNPTSQTVGNGANTTTISFSSNVAGTTYTWTNNNTTIGIGPSGSGSAIASFTATNSGSTPATGSFLVTPTANGVTGPAVAFTVTVNPTIVGNAYVVNILGDNSGINTGASSGSLSGDLRYDINQAIADGLPDTITFDPLIFGAAQAINLNGELHTDPNSANRYGLTAFVISNANITITGSAAGVTLDAGNAQRLFAVTSTGTLTLMNLTLQNGSATGTTNGGGGGAGLGGAVFDDGGILVIQGSTLMSNTANGGAGGTAGNGGGLGSSGVAGSFGVGGPGGGSDGAGGFGGGGGEGSSGLIGGNGGNGGFGGGGGGEGASFLISGNGGSGGFGAGSGYAGLSNPGPSGGGAGLGGAVFNNQGQVTLTNDTLTANTATGGSSSGNSGAGLGAAVFSRNGTVTATFVTFSLNTANQGGTDLYVVVDNSDGGNGTSPGTAFASVRLQNDILGQSGPTSVSDFALAIVSGNFDVGGSNNLFSNTSFGFFFTSPAPGTDPLLGPLASNGGPTQTMALLADSPATGAGVAVTGITTDQRGTLQNSPRDIGAYAAVPPGVLTTSTNSLGLTTTTYGQAGTASTFTLSGELLTNIITVTAPIGMEISDDGGLNFVNSLTLTPTSGTLATTTIFVRFSATAAVGGYESTIAITSSGAIEKDVIATGTVNKAHLTVTANAANRAYGAADPTFTDTFTGFVNSDTASVITGVGAFSTPGTDIATSPAGSTYTITPTLGTLAAANYDFTSFITGVLSVSQAHLTVTGNNASRTYGAADPAFTYIITGFVNGQNASVVSGSVIFSTPGTDVATSPAGSTFDISASQSTLSAANYDFPFFVSGTLTVTKAHLTVTANDASRTYGAADPTFSDTFTGFLNGDAPSVVTGVGAFSTPGTDNATSPVGSTYAITPAQGTLTATNYDFTVFVNGTLSVTIAILTVTANNSSRLYGSADPTFTYVITGYVNGDPTSVVTGTPELSTPAADTATSGAGSTYDITPTQGSLSADNYDFVFVKGTLTVNQAHLTVTANNLSRLYGAVDPTFTDTITGFVNGENASVINGTTTLSTPGTDNAASAAGSTYTITVTPGVLNAANYDFTYVNGTLTVNKAHLTVTALSATRAYGAADPTFNDTITGFVNGQNPTVLTGAPALSTPGADNATSAAGSTYTITVTQNTLAAANYDFTFVNGTLTVTKAHLNVRANTATRAYGSPDPTFGYTLHGFANGDTASVVTGTPAFSTPGTDIATSPPGSTYTITVTQGTLASTNYDFTSFTNSTLTVVKAHLVVAANNASRGFGTPDPTFTDTITGFVNGDTLSVVSGAAVFSTPAADNASSPVGSTYAITVALGTLSAVNYDFIGFTSAILSVVFIAPTVQFTVGSESVNESAGTFSVPVVITGLRTNVITTFASGFSGPGGEAFDAAGNLYVANANGTTVSKVTPAGAVTTFAIGFGHANGLAFDVSGNLYVADANDNSVKEVTPGGTVSTFATGFSQPQDLAFDAAGNLYVSNFSGNTVSIVTPGGVVSLFAIGFSSPEGLAFDTAGNLYVSNQAGNTVSKVTPGGVVSAFATGFNSPAGLAFDIAGNLYVSNAGTGNISVVTPAGAVSVFASGFVNPAGLQFSAGNLYVANFGNNTVSKVSATVTVPFTLSGTAISGTDFSSATVSPLTFGIGQTTANITGTLLPNPGVSKTLIITLSTPTGATLGSLAVNTLTINQPATVQFSVGSETVDETTGSFSIPVTLVGTPTSPLTATPFATGFSLPAGMVYDSAGNLYVANFGSGNVSKVTPAGVVSTFASGFSGPFGLAFDASGNLYVGNHAGNTVSEVTPGGVISLFATGFSTPAGLAFDAAGNLFVANTGANTVSEVTPGGVVTTFATGFIGPVGLAFNAAGNLYVANANGNTISVVTPAGVVSTFASGFSSTEFITYSNGFLYTANAGDGTISKVTPAGVVSTYGSGFASPFGLAVDATGNLYVSTFGNGTVSVFGTSVTVPFTVSGTALSGVDFSGITASPLTFNPGQTTAYITGNLLANPGASKTLTITLGTPTGATLGSPAVNTLTINQPLITVTPTSITPGTTTYGQAGSATTFTISAILLSNDVSVVAPTGVELSDDGGTTYFTALTLTPTGGTLTSSTIFARFSATAGAGAFSGNIQATTIGANEADVAVTGTINKAHLTVAANAASRTYGASDPTFTDTITGFVNSDTASVVSGTASFSTPGSDIATSPAGSTYTITVTQGTLAAANYDFTTFNNSILTVIKAHLTVTADPASRIYGAADPTFTDTITGFVNSQTASVVSGAASFSTPGADIATSPAGSTYTITVTQGTLTAANYDFTTFNDGTLSVGQAALTITAVNKTKAYGAGVPTLTATYSGFVNNETSADLTNLPTLTTTATDASHVSGSPYTITASGAVDNNYSITYVDGNLTVTSVALTITADNQTKVYGAALPTLTATYIGFVNNDTSASLTVLPTLTTTATATSAVTGNPYAITASGAVDTDYTISYVAGSLTVTTAPLTISANNQTKVYGAAVPTLTVAYTGFVNGDTSGNLTTQPTITTTATASSTVAGNPYPITASGAVDSNYTISYVAGSLTVTTAALTITANNQTKIYGAALPTLTASYTGFVNGDTSANLTTQPTITTTATASSNVAGSPYSITPSGAVDSNYTISYVQGLLSVTTAALTITADNKIKPVGAANPTLTATYTGFVNNDTSASLTTPATLATTANIDSIAGAYPITVTGGTDTNYTISNVAGVLTVGGFVDNFNRADSSTLGSNWTIRTGTVGITSNAAVTSTTVTSVATANGSTQVDVIVQADVTLSTIGSYAGLVARYSGPAESNFYLGQVYNINGVYQASIYLNQGGAYTKLAIQNLTAFTPLSTLRFEVVGNELKLFVNNVLQVVAYNSAITTAGLTGLRGLGAAADNFSSNLVQTLTTVLPYSDTFTQPNNSDLSRVWTEQAGAYTVQNNQAADAAYLGLGISVATLNTAPTADAIVQADVTLIGNGAHAGLLARVTDPNTYYIGLVYNLNGVYQARLYVDHAGVYTNFVMHNMTGFTGSGTLRFEVIGNELKLFVNNVLQAIAFDGSITGAGRVGIRSLSSTLDNFTAAAAVVPQTATLPFTDTFTQLDNTNLNPVWTVRAGAYVIKTNQATDAASLASTSLATLNAAAIANVTVQADVTLAPVNGSYAGLVARYSGPDQNNFYVAQIVNLNGVFQASIFLNQAGVYTQLGLTTLTGPTGTQTLRFQLVGNLLQLFVNSVLKLTVTNAVLTTGLVGMRSNNGAFDNFNA